MHLLVLLILFPITLIWLWLTFGPAYRQAFRCVLDSTTPIPPPADFPPVDVIVPARNEAHMLPKTIPSMCGQDYPTLRVILVDDQSDDDSPAILAGLSKAHPNLNVIPGQPRPADWMGKPWAVKQGVDQSTADWLLFTDADCVFHPLVVRQAVGLMIANQLDMLSILPCVEFGSNIERIGLAGMVTALTLLFPIGRANDPKRATALAAGGFILVRRAAYERIGGHAAVRAHIVEDLNLARKLKASGASVHVRMTRDLVSTRMYEGFADLWEGLTKNAYAGMEYHPLKFAAGLVGALVLIVLPPLYLLAAIVWAARHPAPAPLAALAMTIIMNLCVVIVHSRTIRMLRLPIWHALLMPVSAGLYTIISIASAWQHHFRGGNVWKGRRYAPGMVVAADGKS